MILQAWEKNAGEQKNHDKWDSKGAILPPFYCHSSPLTNSQMSYPAGPTEVQLRQPRQCLGTRTCHQKARSAQEIVLPWGFSWMRCDFSICKLGIYTHKIYTPGGKHGTWKLAPGRVDSYWKPSFSASMLNFGGGGNMDTPPKTKMEPQKMDCFFGCFSGFQWGILRFHAILFAYTYP